MNEFTFVCPVCGQHIKCESWRSNTMMECPTCFQRIIVPQSPAGDDVELIIKGSKATRRQVTKPVMGLGTPPVPTPPEKQSPMAGIVLAISVCTVIAVVLVLFVLRGKIFQSTNTQSTTASQNNSVPVQRTPAQPANPVPVQRTPVQPVNPAPVQNGTSAQPVVIESPATGTNWTLTLGEAMIPDAPVTGRIHGRNFIRPRVYLEAGTLTMRTVNPGPPDLGFSIYLHANQSRDLAGQMISVTSDLTKAPNVRLRWKDDQQQPATRDFNKGYALRIEFGQVAGNRLQGKFYLAVPDGMESYVAGTFDAEIRKPKSSQ